MPRRFCFRLRSLLAMLLAFCLVSASLWSYGAEAAADALSDELALTTAGTGMPDHGPADKACNHGCHAQTHLTGLDSGPVSLPVPEATETRWAASPAVIPSHPREGTFRPPRTPFQA